VPAKAKPQNPNDRDDDEQFNQREPVFSCGQFFATDRTLLAAGI